MLIRFFQLSSEKFRRAFNEGSLDFDDVMGIEDERALADIDQPQQTDSMERDGDRGKLKTQKMAR
jgi:hypothetical protein